jgi:peptidoglycan biosynthesis protein MviN/MurJ (putative lipid II flippase)
LLILLSAANVASGLVLQFSFVLLAGVGAETDAYFAAQTVPMLASAILAGALTNNLTPLASRLDAMRAAALIRAASLQCALLVTALFGMLAFTAQWWLQALFAGIALDHGQRITELGWAFCAISALQVVSAIGIAGHYARGQFVFVETVQLAGNLLILVLLGPVIKMWGIPGFVWLLVARAAATLLVTNYRFAAAARAPVDEFTTALWKSTRQIMSASVVFKLGPTIDRMLASLAAPGILTSLGIGQQVLGSAFAVTERAIMRPFQAAAGARAAPSARREMLEIYYQQMRIVLLTIAAGLIVALPLALIVVQGGRIPGVPALPVSLHLDLILLMALTLIPGAAGQLSSSMMYALGEVKSINRLALISFFISTALKAVGFLYIGAYAIIAGIFLYQSLNWLFMHRAAVRIIRQSDS